MCSAPTCGGGGEGTAGRTLVELIVALAVVAMAVAILALVQVSGMRWWRGDLQAIRATQPVRNAGDAIARDVRYSLRALAGPDFAPGSLVLERQHGNETWLVGYHLEGGSLYRTRYDPASHAALEQVRAASGVSRFAYSVTDQVVSLELAADRPGGGTDETTQPVSMWVGW